MKTSSQTTYLLLERGVEDKALLSELNKMVARLKINSVKAMTKEYPIICELMNGLKQEISSHDQT